MVRFAGLDVHKRFIEVCILDGAGKPVFRGQVGCYDTCPVVANPWDDRSLWEVWPVADPTDPSSRVTGGPQDPVADHSVRWGLYLGYAFD